MSEFFGEYEEPVFKEYEPIDDGLYLAVLREIVIEKGDSRLDLTWCIKDGKFEGRLVPQRLYYANKSSEKINKDKIKFNAIRKIYGNVKSEAMELQGVTAVIKVWNSTADNGKTYTNVTRIYDVSEQPNIAFGKPEKQEPEDIKIFDDEIPF